MHHHLYCFNGCRFNTVILRILCRLLPFHQKLRISEWGPKSRFHPVSQGHGRHRLFVPIFKSTCAIFSVRSAEKTPSNCAGASAGLVSGPRTLKIVRTPISLRGPIAYFIARCNEDAKRKLMPTESRHSFILSAEMVILTPRASRTSALPHLLETDLLPCFATEAPAPAATNAVAVETLNVLLPSPPVPHVSTINDGCAGVIRCFISHYRCCTGNLINCFHLSYVMQ